MGFKFYYRICFLVFSCVRAHSVKVNDISLPEGPLIIGYQNWGACDENETITAVSSGVNVLIWFAINLIKTDEGLPGISGGPNTDCFASLANELDNMGLITTHLISIGGWDSPHPDSSFTGEEYYQTFHLWNQNLTRPFDGFDWDLEGNDDSSSSNNVFTSITLNQIIDMSVMAKQDGYIVSMVPAQSYLDSTTSLFNTSLLNNYPDYQPDFYYHGMNCYAYLLAASPSSTFDIITVQLYESWSRANQQLIQIQMKSYEYLLKWWSQITSSNVQWEVDFGSNETNGLRISGIYPIEIPLSKLVVGLSRGDSQGKSAFIWPKDAGIAYKAARGHEPRGFAFWCIANEGSYANGTNTTLSFAPSLNEFLHAR